MTSEHLLELLFSQSLDGFFFMMLDEPITWPAGGTAEDKAALIEYAFTHQRITRVNDAMLAQYGATPSQFLGLTPQDMYRHAPAEGRRIWREFFDRGQLHVRTEERRLDGTPIVIEGDYICLYDEHRRLVGHFGIQRDVTEETRLRAEVAAHAAQLEARVIERTAALQQSERRASELEYQNLYLREALEADLHFGDIIGRSKPMQALFHAIELVAGTDTSVLLLGDTGTGKELIARAIHRLSRRSKAPLVKVNCGALPATLVESELFGHERGAFTGALQQKKGRFDLAHRGTILLDEIGELPLDAQVKLLRVLQEQEFERVGGTQTVRVDARIIAATNRDLEADVRRGTFRPDLFFRLNVFPIYVPPLRERPDDIPLLAEHFVREFSRRLGRSIDSIDRRAVDKLQAYDWPGNVRELTNILERAVILCRDRVLGPSHIGLPARPAVATWAAAPGDTGLGTLEEAERRHIRRALAATGGVLAGPRGAAAMLGVNRSTLWSRMQRLGIQAARADRSARADIAAAREAARDSGPPHPSPPNGCA